MDEELKKILEHLHLRGLLAHWDELLAAARHGRFSHERLLKHVLEAEYHTKREQARLLHPVSPGNRIRHALSHRRMITRARPSKRVTADGAIRRKAKGPGSRSSTGPFLPSDRDTRARERARVAACCAQA